MNNQLTLNSTIINNLLKNLSEDDSLRDFIEKNPTKLIDLIDNKISNFHEKQINLPSKSDIKNLLNRFDSSISYLSEENSSSLVTFVFRFFQREKFEYAA